MALAAQAKPPAKDPYAGESFVIERADWVYAMNADGTGYRERTVAVKLQSDASLRTFGVITLGFAGASEHVEFHYVRVRHADGGVTETPGSDAIEQPQQVTQEAPFYSDLKEEQLPVKNLQVGDTLEWQARIVRTRAEAPNEFWGTESFVTDDAVTQEESIELRVPAREAVTVWTNPSLDPAPAPKTEGAVTVYRWQSSQLKPTTGPQADAAKKAKKTKLLTPAEELDAEQGKLPSVAWTTFKSWADVGAWYRGLEDGRATPGDEIKAKVAELTAGRPTEEDKVRAVYAYVSTQIRYIGVDFGVGRFQPHEAVDVLHNQYGDCKDKATLLSAMLSAIGLHADAVLIGSGIRFNEAVPSPAAFDHLITRVKVGDSEVWLDSTEEVAPYRVLMYPLRDKESLVIPDTGPATIERTPRDLPFPSLDVWKAVGTLNKDGISESHITYTLRGDDELYLRMVVHQIAPAQYDEFAQKFVNSFGYAGTTSHASFSPPEETATPFVFSFDYHREKAGDWDNLKLIPQLDPLELPAVDEANPPVQSINLGTPRTAISTAEMKLPEGWGVQLPEAVHEKAPFATFDLTYRFDHGTLYTGRTLVILERKVPASDWKAYKKWTDAVGLGLDQYVQLTQGGGATGTTPAPGVAPARQFNQEAETLIQQAVSAAQKMDDKTAELLLKRARAINPQARRLWAAYGFLAVMRGELNDAIEDFRKELALYPDAYEEYGAIAGAQAMHHDKVGAEATLRQWAAAVPSDPKPEQRLAAMLLQDGDGPGAVAAITKAIADSSGDQQSAKDALQVFLGQAQLKAGMTQQGEATLVALLQSADDPATMNDAAYELADANKDLPLDEAKERLALAKLSTETQSWTLDEAPATLKVKTTLLVASWDTMGWILFREGKTKEAKTYIDAAWHNMPDSDETSHLDQVDKALGEAPETGGGGKSDQQRRIISLGSSGGTDAVAEYRLLLSHGKLERAEPTGSKTVANAEEMMRAISFREYFPADSDARLVRTAVLNCHSGKCELVLEP